MITVRSKVTTNHATYGRLTYGLIILIKPQDFNTVQFERIPEKPEDIEVADRDSKGNLISKKKRLEIQKKSFRAFNKKKKQYEHENELAINRLGG